MIKNYCLDQWSSRCTLVYTSVHENYSCLHEIIFGVHELKFLTYTRYS